jgi:hypothetical protein
MVGAPKGSRLLGPLGHIGKVRLASLRASQKVVLQELLAAGTATPVVERSYPLSGPPTRSATWARDTPKESSSSPCKAS